MRLVLSAAVLALWVTETPSNVVTAFSLKGQPRFSNRPRYSGLTAPSSLYMSTIERPMTAPNSPNSAGHPFGAYGKPSRDGNGDDNAYSYGPKFPPGTVDKSLRNSNAPPTGSFEAYMQGQSRGGAPPSNPSSPSDNYFSRQQPAPTSNFGAPTTNSSNNFGAPSTPSTHTANNGSFSDFATRGNPSTPPPANNNFGAPSAPQTQAPPAASTTGNNNNSFASFVTGGSTSSPPPPPPAPGSFEAYMNNRQSQAPPSSGSTPPFPSSPDSQNRIASTVAAAADPNSPLPPYMSPASLEDASIKSANFSGSDGRPNLQAPMPGMATQQQTFTAAAQTTFREQDTSMQNQIAQPISAPLARVGTPAGQLDISNPSQELVGRLDQVLTKQREFEVRLDKVDEKIDRTTQENIQRTQSMLNDFREDNKKTQETFLNRINSEVHGMKSTMDKVLQEQRDLQQKQENQSASFANLEMARSEQSEKLLTLEKTTSIRAQNLERNSSQETKVQTQRLEALEKNAMGGGSPQVGGGSDPFQAEQHQNERMAAFEQAQLERMAAFEDSQRQELENTLRLHRESSQQHQNKNDMNGGMNNANNPAYQREQAHMDETERQLQDRLEQAQNRKEELLQQLREMQQQEEMHSNNGNDRGRNEDPHSARGGSSAPPPPSPYANPLDQQHQFRQPPGSPSARFEDEEEEEEPPRRRMMRDRLGKTSGEELYQPSGAGRRGADRMDNFDDKNGFDGRTDDRTMGMDPEEERRMQHERLMRRDPVDPPVAMGGRSRRGKNSPGSPAGRYDPRRGGPSDDMMEDELAYGIGRDSSMKETLGNMRSFKGDEQLPNRSLFDGSGGMGGAGAMGQRGSPQQGSHAPARQADRDMREQQQPPPQHRSGPKQRRAGLSQGPPPNPMVDKKIEHFLKETLTGGTKSHFDKELESLLMVKYSPLFSWLKPANVSFLRNVLVTYLQHKGCQVEMDLKNTSPKAAREWDELLNILSFELNQRTGEDPRIIEEPNNQWGIYGSKNMRMKISAANNSAQQDRQRSRGGGVSREEAARRKRRNDKAFTVSTDPTDPSTRLL